MKLIKLSATHSTNAFVKSLLEEVAPEDETVVWADAQTQGKGQQGSSWHSVPGQSLTISLFRRFEHFPARYQNYLNLAISLGVYRALSVFRIPALAVKWPNDILSDGHKICGILVENRLDGSYLGSSVIGIGLNVNESGFDDLPQATSMKLVTGRQFDLEEVFEKLVAEVFEAIRALNTHTLPGYQQGYDRLLFRKDIHSEFQRPDGTRFGGIIRGVDQQGRLLVESNGSEQAYQPKQIRLLY